MSGTLLDSNILIDLFNGIEAAMEEWARYERPAISVVTWIEVMAGVEREDDKRFRAFLNDMERIDLTPEIAERAAAIRRDNARRMKLPDAIIWATAQVQGLTLVTRNEQDFPEGTPGVRVPYRI